MYTISPNASESKSVIFPTESTLSSPENKKSDFVYYEIINKIGNSINMPIIKIEHQITLSHDRKNLFNFNTSKIINGLERRRPIELSHSIDSGEIHHKDIQSMTPFTIYSYHQIDALSQNDCNQDLKYHLTSEVVDFLKTHAFNYFLKALEENLKSKEQRKKLKVKIGNNLLIFTPSGKAYLTLNDLGSGAFKSTVNTVLVASLSLDLLKNSFKYRAFSYLRSHPPGSKHHLNEQQEIKSFENEIKIHLFLREQVKKFKLNCFSTAKSVVNIINDENQKKINHENRMDDHSESQGHISNESLSKGFMTELCAGNVSDLIFSWPNSIENREFLFLAQMAYAVNWMHKLGLVHRDIKLSNFLYTSKNDKIKRFKLADFGLSSFIQKSQRYYSPVNNEYITDPYWLSVHFKKYSKACFRKESDIYQLGIAFYQLLTKQTDNALCLYFDQELAKQNATIHDTQKALEFKQHPEKWKFMDQIADSEIKQMLLRMLSPNLKERPTAKQVKVFFQKMHRKNPTQPIFKVNLPNVADTAPLDPYGYEWDNSNDSAKNADLSVKQNSNVVLNENGGYEFENYL